MNVYSQAMMMIPGQSGGEFRDDGYDRRMGDIPSVHVRDSVDQRAYAADPMSVHLRDNNDRYYDDAAAAQRFYVSYVPVCIYFI